MNVQRWTLLLLIVGICASCNSNDAATTDTGATDSGNGVTDGGGNDGATSCTVIWTLTPGANTTSSCTRPPTDYIPGSAEDPYPDCISDDNTYHRFESSIGTIGRVAGFETIAQLLLTGSAPSSQAFTDARVTYTESEGLDSRVSRREDEHYAPANKKCADMTEAEIQQNPDRCVGQARIQPLLNDAFRDGSRGVDPLLNAARIEAGLLWFLYVSTHKEAITCTNTKKDCDSSYAYYTGGETRDKGLGLARYVNTVASETHNRIWDGILGVRCWRDLDSEAEATDLAQRDQAVKQMDTALLHGMARLVARRVAAYGQATCDPARAALWETIKILGGVLDREATQRDATNAMQLREELAKPHQQADMAIIESTLGTLFPCP